MKIFLPSPETTCCDYPDEKSSDYLNTAASAFAAIQPTHSNQATARTAQTLRRTIEAKTLPKTINMSDRMTAWWESEICQWLDNLSGYARRTVFNATQVGIQPATKS